MRLRKLLIKDYHLSCRMKGYEAAQTTDKDYHLCRMKGYVAAQTTYKGLSPEL